MNTQRATSERDSIPPLRIHHGARGAAGPLLYLPASRRTMLGESVSVVAPGQGARRGQVIDAGEEITVIQLLEDPIGVSPARSEILLSGTIAETPVGRDLLGRMLDGGGRPLDDLPPPTGEALRSLWGAPINPVKRKPPRDFIETGISAIDGLNTLVRGQKLPVFSGAGLPGLELAAMIVESARTKKDEPFAVIFAGIGITEREADLFLNRFEASGALERSVIYLNKTSDPTIERLSLPRLALCQAEYLAFEHGMHVLVVLADITHYCEALREISTAREEIPGRRGYPGYMYTDLATLFERAGVLADATGSVTQLPILSMPDDDITHPIPDLTGYITEGQIVLSRDLHRRGIFPPIDVLPSLSRLMNAGIGEHSTVKEHREWANQLYAIYAQAREARSMEAIVGEAGLGPADRRALEIGTELEKTFIHQGTERRSIEETIEIGWSLLDRLPRSDLMRISDATWERRHG